MKKYDVVALGELLIDFTENGTSKQGNPLFEANPGGAPCNVLAMLNKLGQKTAFIGKVGKDGFGYQLKETLEETGIDASYLQMDNEVHTTLALVKKMPDGNRDFSFYRNPGADMMLTEEEVPEEIFKEMKLFHFGTLSMTDEKVRAATVKALKLAKENHVKISFDPNLRPPLWKSLEEAKTQTLFGLQYCDILKISDNEIQWLTGCEDFDEGARWIQAKFPNISIILLTMGKDGSKAYTRNYSVYVPGFLQEHTIETTGAGDTFCGCMLHALYDIELSEISKENQEKKEWLKEKLTFANAGASIITTRNGALRVMPEKDEIEEFVKSR